MLGINMLINTGISFIDKAVNGIINFFVEIFFKGYFLLVKAIAWILDMLTQLFFIFAGMTPISTTSVSGADGYDSVDIVNYFLTQTTFQKAYLYLCLVALGLIVVFTIGKIIKQDYFERSGPRSKAPIFRNVALSFIAFICIIPVFLFLIEVVGALTLLVMKALGYKGGGIGTLLFNMSWEDGGASIRSIAQSIEGSDMPDSDNFGWYPTSTFYEYYWDASTASSKNYVGGDSAGLPIQEFYWFTFIFAGLILIVNLGKMLLSMVSRLYKLIALFIVAPSPISQIVLDDGAKFRSWKDNVLQEALKVVGCVMCFMIFMLIAGAVNEIDLMRYAFTEEAATALNIIEGNSIPLEMSNSISALYYGGDTANGFDKAINALGKAMILIAGVGAIQDMDQVITPLISGGKSSIDSGATGKAITTAAGAAANGALGIGRAGIGAAVNMATSAVSLGAGLGLTALKGINKGFNFGKNIAGSGDNGDEGSDDSTAQVPEGGTQTGAATPTSAGDSNAPDGAATPTSAGNSNAPDGAATPTSAGNSNAPDGAATPTSEGDSDAPDGAAQMDNRANPVVEDESNEDTQDVSSFDGHFNTLHSSGITSKGAGNTSRGLTKAGGIAKGVVGGIGGIARGAVSITLGAAGKTLKTGGKVAATALKTGTSVAGIVAKTSLKMAGMGSVVKSIDEFSSGVTRDIVGSVKGLGTDLVSQGKKFKKEGNLDRGTLIGDIGHGTSTIAHAAGGAVAKGIGAAASAPFRGAAKLVDKVDQSRVRMSDANKQALNTLVNKSKDDVLDATIAIENKKLSDQGVSVQADNALNAVNEQINSATIENDLGQSVIGKRNQQMDSSVDLINLQGVRMNATTLNDHLKNSKRNTPKGYSNKTNRYNDMVSNKEGAIDIVAMKSGIASLSTDLQNKYSTSIKAVEEAKKNGTVASEKDRKLYAEYSIQADRLDSAYRYVDGDKQIGEAAYDNVRSQVESTDSYKEIIAAKQIDNTHGRREYLDKHNVKSNIEKMEKGYEEGMLDRAENAYEQFDYIQNDATAVDKLKYQQFRYANAKDSYDNALNSGKKSKIRDARANLQAAGVDLRNASNNLRDVMDGTKDAIIEQSKRNQALNVGNAKIDNAKATIRTNIQRMKANNANPVAIDKAERRLEALEAQSTGPNAKNAYENRERKRVKVTATGKLDRLANKTTRQANRAEKGKTTPNLGEAQQRMRNATSGNGGNNPVEVDVDLEILNPGKHNISEGIGSKDLTTMVEEYHNHGGHSMSEKDAKKFMAKVGKINIEDIDDSQFIEAVKNLKSANIPEKYRGYKLGEYKKDIKTRYEKAASEYKQNMSNAVTYAQQYENSNDPEKLKAVEESIAKAVGNSEQIRIIKTEIKDNGLDD